MICLNLVFIVLSTTLALEAGPQCGKWLAINDPPAGGYFQMMGKGKVSKMSNKAFFMNILELIRPNSETKTLAKNSRYIPFFFLQKGT